MDHYRVAHTDRVRRIGAMTITMVCCKAVAVRKMKKKIRRKMKRASHSERVGVAFCGVMVALGILCIVSGPWLKYLF